MCTFLFIWQMDLLFGRYCHVVSTRTVKYVVSEKDVFCQNGNVTINTKSMLLFCELMWNVISTCELRITMLACNTPGFSNFTARYLRKYSTNGSWIRCCKTSSVKATSLVIYKLQLFAGHSMHPYPRANAHSLEQHQSNVDRCQPSLRSAIKLTFVIRLQSSKLTGRLRVLVITLVIIYWTRWPAIVIITLLRL